MSFNFPPSPYDTGAVLAARTPVEEDVIRLNDWIIGTLSNGPWIWKFTEPQIREARRNGAGVFPVEPHSPHAENLTIEDTTTPVPLRLIFPSDGRKVDSAYLHIHGGGWTFGAADMQDPMLQEIANACSCLCISVDYRLAPEHPYPAAQDDCEAAARWFLNEGAERYGITRFAIGGESAGAHLSLCTLLRLKARDLNHAFCGANLVCGVYDLTLTPSVRNWGEEKLVLNSDDIGQFRQRYLSGDAAKMDWYQSDISPLYGDLTHLPPCLITAGTQDLLLDDSLFLHERLETVTSPNQLALYPGGCHVFPLFDIEMGRKALRHCEDFLKQCFDSAQSENS
ncbi:alpha/beta hydrolase [Cohaesibacter gelatinilyticus]|uniref:Acetyl esterase/lipase n=1 Tax=Cohaesibacter gelatinilyticus TaxID=372072 RepID=A0A285N852_9HYPH|nr:alpha/beta hydrolase [Cohaesibacter gelatinilyticus]SNZ05057.1 Acetyl esterase/lipase [Cohaesibacter gelatinilyticus]